MIHLGDENRIEFTSVTDVGTFTLAIEKVDEGVTFSLDAPGDEFPTDMTLMRHEAAYLAGWLMALLGAVME